MQRGCVIFIIAASLAILVCSVILRIFFMPAYQAKGTARIIGVIEMAINEYQRDFAVYPQGQNLSLTKKLLGDNARSPTYIKTLPNVGYCLIANVDAIIQQKQPLNEKVHWSPAIAIRCYLIVSPKCLFTDLALDY